MLMEINSTCDQGLSENQKQDTKSKQRNVFPPWLSVFVSVEVCSVLAGETGHLREGRSVGEQHQRV